MAEQFLNVADHHDVYPAIDPAITLKGSAAGKVIFLSGASQGIGQATAVAFAKAGAEAVYITARSEHALQETQSKVLEANPATKCAYSICDVTDLAQVKAATDDCVTQVRRNRRGRCQCRLLRQVGEDRRERSRELVAVLGDQHEGQLLSHSRGSAPPHRIG